MTVRIEVVADDGAAVAFQLRQFLSGVQTVTPAPAAAPVVEAPAAEAAAPKKGRPPKAAPATAEQPVEPTPLEKAVEAAKPEPTPIEKQVVQPAEPEAPAYDEAKCRAGLQKLHSLYSAKSDGPSGIKAAQAICAEFNVKKVSDLTAEQHKPFCDRIEAAIQEMGK